MGFPSNFKEESSIQDILTKCIDFELSQHQHQHQNDHTNNYNKDEWLTMEMAVLLYMGKLNDAFLLWRRAGTVNTQQGQEEEERAEGLNLLWRIGSAMFQHESAAAFKAIHDILLHTMLPRPLNHYQKCTIKYMLMLLLKN